MLLSILVFIQTCYSIKKDELNLLPKKQTLSLLTSQWYYIYIKSFADISRIKSALPNIEIPPLNIKGNCVTLFLKPTDARTLNQLPNIQVYTRKQKRVTLSTTQNNETYLIYAHPTYKPPLYSQIISQSGPFYFISTSQPTTIENDPNVLSIQKVPPLRTMNRWATGFIQSGDSNYLQKDGYLTSNRKFNDRGLNGSNVIVTLIDTGASSINCFLFDQNYPRQDYNRTNFAHRKIVRYDIFTRNVYKSVRHGTHCAGIIAGSTDTFPMSLYNGQAPAAKLYVGDIGMDDEERIDVSFTFDIFQRAKELNSPIISCSWGDPETKPELTHMIDYLSYENPEQLFVFAAGNEFMYYRIGSPGNSKNVLTVTSSYPPRSYYLADSSHVVRIVGEEGEVLNVHSANIFMAMQKHEISYLKGIDVVDYEKDVDGKQYEDKIVVVYEISPSSSFYINIFDFLVKNKAKIAVVFDFYSANHDDLLVISAPSQNMSFFRKNRRVDVTIDPPEKTKEMGPADYCSKGPTKYGIRKPDIMAPGTSIMSASSRKNTNKCDPKISLTEMSGTSMATPAVSGSLALVYQYLKESIHGLPFDRTKRITSALLRAFAVAGAGEKAGIEQGYGNINLSRILVYPDIDKDFGIRFYSDRTNTSEFLSFFVKATHVGSLSVTLTWIDVPLNLESLYPLFAYFEFFVIGPDGRVYDVDEQFSTNKKIVIQNATPGSYEIRLRMNQIVPDDSFYNVDYSIVVVGPFEQLDFESNPSEMKPLVSKFCSSKCPSNMCNAERAECACDKLKTGTHCEFEVDELKENVAVKKSMLKREFWFTHIDVSKYRGMSKSEREKCTFSIKVRADNYVYSSGYVRYFFNTNNKLPLTTPSYLVQWQKEVDAMIEYPLENMIEMEDVYLTVFNDYGIDISFSFNWTVKSSIFSAKSVGINNLNGAFDGESSDPKQTNSFKAWMLIMIVAGCVAVAAILAFMAVKIAKNKKSKKEENYQTYTDA